MVAMTIVFQRDRGPDGRRRRRGGGRRGREGVPPFMPHHVHILDWHAKSIGTRQDGHYCTWMKRDGPARHLERAIKRRLATVEVGWAMESLHYPCCLAFLISKRTVIVRRAYGISNEPKEYLRLLMMQVSLESVTSLSLPSWIAFRFSRGVRHTG